MAFRIQPHAELAEELRRIALEELRKARRDASALERGEEGRRAAVRRRGTRLRALVELVGPATLGASSAQTQAALERLAGATEDAEQHAALRDLRRSVLEWEPREPLLPALLAGFEALYRSGARAFAHLDLEAPAARFAECGALVRRHADQLRLLRSWSAERPPRELARLEALARLLDEVAELAAQLDVRAADGSGRAVTAVRSRQVRQQVVSMGRACFARPRHVLAERLEPAARARAQLDAEPSRGQAA